jgi:hypothetical protein
MTDQIKHTLNSTLVTNFCDSVRQVRSGYERALSNSPRGFDATLASELAYYSNTKALQQIKLELTPQAEEVLRGSLAMPKDSVYGRLLGHQEHTTERLVDALGRLDESTLSIDAFSGSGSATVEDKVKVDAYLIEQSVKNKLADFANGMWQNSGANIDHYTPLIQRAEAIAEHNSACKF